MKTLILDDERTRRNDLAANLRKKRMEITPLSGSNDFINAVEKGGWDLLLLDMESWNRGRPIYERFGIAKKLDKTPIVFYNARPNFPALDGREKNPRDRVLEKPTETEAVIAALPDSR